MQIKQKTKKRNHTEDWIQRAVAEHLALRKRPGVVWWHTPNGGKRHPREARRLKEMGVRAGVSDLILVHNKEIFCLELKAPKGRESESQLQFLEDMKRAGAFCEIAYGLDEALATLEAWGLIRGWVGTHGTNTVD